MKKAFQLDDKGKPVRSLGLREFTDEAWAKLMDYYKVRKLKPKWKLVKEKKKRAEKIPEPEKEPEKEPEEESENQSEEKEMRPQGRCR